MNVVNGKTSEVRFLNFLNEFNEAIKAQVGVITQKDISQMLYTHKVAKSILDMALRCQLFVKLDKNKYGRKHEEITIEQAIHVLHWVKSMYRSLRSGETMKDGSEPESATTKSTPLESLKKAMLPKERRYYDCFNEFNKRIRENPFMSVDDRKNLFNVHAVPMSSLQFAIKTNLFNTTGSSMFYSRTETINHAIIKLIIEKNREGEAIKIIPKENIQASEEQGVAPDPRIFHTPFPEQETKKAEISNPENINLNQEEMKTNNENEMITRYAKAINEINDVIRRTSAFPNSTKKAVFLKYKLGGNLMMIAVNLGIFNNISRGKYTSNYDHIGESDVVAVLESMREYSRLGSQARRDKDKGVSNKKSETKAYKVKKIKRPKAVFEKPKKGKPESRILQIGEIGRSFDSLPSKERVAQMVRNFDILTPEQRLEFLRCVKVNGEIEVVSKIKI